MDFSFLCCCKKTSPKKIASMNVLVVVSPSHEFLYQEHFLKTLPQGVSVIEHRLDMNGNGAYLSKDWQTGVVSKLEVVLAYAKGHAGEVFILSDIDIQFFPTFKIEDSLKDFKQAGVDVLFQREVLRTDSREVNTGFYIARSTPYVINLLQDAIAICSKSSSQNDQVAINQLLRVPDFGKKWGLLPKTYYARSHGFPPQKGIIIHHANRTLTTYSKAIQLRRVRKLIMGGMVCRYIPIFEEIMDYMISGEVFAMLWRRIAAR
jgi:hypothetical protein